MIGCDLDLLHRLPDRALANDVGRSFVDHGPTPRVAGEQGSWGIVDRSRELVRPSRGEGLDGAAAKTAVLMSGTPPRARTKARQIAEPEVRAEELAGGRNRRESVAEASAGWRNRAWQESEMTEKVRGSAARRKSGGTIQKREGSGWMMAKFLR